MNETNNSTEPKFKPVIEGANQLSLGLSMVIAILLGVGIGIVMENIFGYTWLFWLGVFWGVAAAIMNIRIEYKKIKKELDEVAKDPKYKNYKIKKKEDDLEEFEK